MKEPVRKRGGQPKDPAGRKRNNLTFRTRDQLREKLDAAAGAAGRSISEEIESRLERSFQTEDVFTAALGGRDLRNHALMMISSFAAGGQAIANGRPASEWLRDQDAYRAAFVQAAVAMVEAMPKPTIEEKSLALITLKDRIASVLTRTDELKFDFGDGRGPVATGFQPPKKDDVS